MSPTSNSKAEAAVIGNPVSHSRSPAIFSFLASKLGRKDFSYAAKEVKGGEELAAFLASMRANPGFVGANVTIPHKEAILKSLDDVAPEARAIGAVNVVQMHEGELYGHNTDVLGIVRTLQEQGCKIAGEDAWVWGAGGAARAAAFALASMGARSVYLQNRDLARAEKIRDDIGSLFPNTSFVVARPGSEAHAQPLTLLVNATPVGMKGSAAENGFFAGIRELRLKRGALAFDMIYNPERTPFLARAEEQGLRCVSGLDMLVYQALATWEIWFGPLGELPELQSLKDALMRHLRERPIFLTGFMGVGKSVVGMTLASRLGWDFLDTDEMVVKKAGMPIPKIFESQGEPAFRALEIQAVHEASARGCAVVSLGGGALMSPESLAAIERSGSLVYLDASAEYLQSRLTNTSGARPLLAGLDDRARGEKIRALLAERAPIYDRAAFKIATDDKRPSEVADGILRLLFSEAAFHSVVRAKEGA
jgi:shikimate dehydrogenase